MSNIAYIGRWNSREWLERDLAAITATFGPLPLNHLKKQAPPQVAFGAWLNATLKPATVDHVLNSDEAYAQAYSIFKSLAEHQRGPRHNYAA